MITVADAVNEFLIVKEAGQRAPATLAWYRALLKPFAATFGDRTIDSMVTVEIARWLIAQSGTANTVYDRDKVLRSFWGWVALAYDVRSPMKAIPTPRLPEPEPRAIEPDDLNRLIEVAMSPRDRAILIVLADCGLRASGLIRLTIEDVDFAARLIRVTEKRQRTRSVPFSLDTERALIAWCARRPLTADALFCSRYGQHLKYAGLRQIIRRLAARAGFTNERCNLHSLRHFAAREYLRNGGTLPSLARILGHKTIDTTARFYAIYGVNELAEIHDAHSPLHSLKKGDVI